ncbi:MAG: hypothetical protein ACM3YN_02215 [Parcubacteria group bacterium]
MTIWKASTRCSKSARRSSRAASLAAILLLAACGKPAEQAPAPKPAAPTPPPLVWSGDGHALELWQDGLRLLKIECDRKTGLTVHGSQFKPVGSEERMSVGAGDVVMTLVATPDGPAVKGEGAPDPDFLRAFGEGRKFAVNYGYQNMGPYDGPPRDLAEPFAAACMSGL